MNRDISSMLNVQIQKELESAYIYLYFASYFDSIGLAGFSSWFKKQAQEEEGHAMRFYDFMHEIGENISFLPIAKPDIKTENVLQVLKQSLEHEKYITGLIYNIYSEAEKECDYKTQDFLKWFITEQREEEKQVRDIIDKYYLYCGSESACCGSGLYELNRELSKREE